MKHTGTLSALVTFGGGAEPVAGARVRIFGEGADYSLITDSSGSTSPVSLEAPSRSYSLTPNAAVTPYAVYQAEISASGFYTTRVIGIAVFEGIASTLPVELVPTSRIRADENLPNGYTPTKSQENEELL